MKVMKSIGSIFRSKIPQIATAKMPDPGSFANKVAARDKIAERKKKKGGRDSTIYSGQTYSGSNLGGTA